jgi:predicted RNase H-like HicB family nuclease
LASFYWLNFYWVWCILFFGGFVAEKEFTVIIEKDEDGWLIADVPELQACHTQAKTLDDLMKRVKEVIQLCLEEQKEEQKSSFVGIQIVRV